MYNMCISKIGFLSSDKPAGRLTSEGSFSVRDRKSLIAIVCHSINEFCPLCIFQANPLCYPTQSPVIMAVTCWLGRLMQCRVLSSLTGGVRHKSSLRRNVMESRCWRQTLPANWLMDAAADQTKLADSHVPCKTNGKTWWIFHGVSIIQTNWRGSVFDSSHLLFEHFAQVQVRMPGR